VGGAPPAELFRCARKMRGILPPRMKDPRERFSAVAEAYHRFRPSYPPALIDWIEATSGVPAGGRVADLGCGTGIWSRLLAARGYLVAGIDPNQEMLALAREAGGGPTYLAGDAVATGLGDASIDLATAAQAFHWFPLAATLAELDRILRPGAWTCAVWNQRTSTAFNDEYEELLQTHSSEYARNERLSDLRTDPRGPIAAAIPHAVTTELPSQDELSWESVLGRAHSASYVMHGIPDLPAFERALRQAYERHARPDGTLVWSMRTIAIAWRR
jgi:ubiquinone/menaquinone biosynthesis C-methylase UbiE